MRALDAGKRNIVMKPTTDGFIVGAESCAVDDTSHVTLDSASRTLLARPTIRRTDEGHLPPPPPPLTNITMADILPLYPTLAR